jgi:hypothetical protein
MTHVVLARISLVIPVRAVAPRQHVKEDSCNRSEKRNLHVSSDAYTPSHGDRTMRKVRGILFWH